MDTGEDGVAAAAEDALVKEPVFVGWRALRSNLHAGLLLALMRRSGPQYLRTSVAQLLALIALSLGLGLIGDLLRTGLVGQFNLSALPYVLFGVPWMLLTAWVSARAAGNESLGLRAATGLAALWWWFALLGQAMAFLPATAWQSLGEFATIIWWLPFALALLASVVALVRVTGMLPEQRVGAILAVVYLLALPQLVSPNNRALWIARDNDEAESAAQRARWELPTREAVLYSQPRLLAETLARVARGTPGKPELFLIALGGHANQDVFMREVKSVEQLFAQRFDTSGHSVVLLNNPTTLSQYPIASVTALEQVVDGVAQKMNRDEDVLFLFMTSHGSDDFRFDLSMWPYQFEDLTPQKLKTILDRSRIRHRVVVVSSCYSGGFVPPLADNETWVMTAARADRNSHGCSHTADWTFFGRAYFNEALRNTYSFQDAFEVAKQSVATREKEEGLKPSEPQTGGGDLVKKVLRTIEARVASGSRLEK